MSMGNYPHPQKIRNFSDLEKETQRQAASALLRTVSEAVASGKKEVTISGGFYRFGHADAASFSVKGAECLDIIGGDDVEFIQETNGSVIRLINCKNVTLKGVKVDYADMKYVQFTVCGFNESGEPILSVDENYKPNFEKYRSMLFRSRVLYYDALDLTREKVSSNTRGFLNELIDLGDSKYQLTYRDQITTMLTPLVGIKEGDKAVVIARGGDHAVVVEGCEGVTLEDVDIYASGAFGISEHSCPGGNTYRRVRMIRRPDTDRLICTTRDGFHSQNVKKGALIEECEFSYAEDDLLNAHCFNGVVTEIYSDTEYEITFPLNTSLDPDTDLCFICNGEFVRSKAIEVNRVLDNEKITKYKNLNTIIRDTVNRGIRTFDSPNIYRVRLNKAVSAEIFCEVSGEVASSSGLIIRNCYFHDSHCMAAIVTGPNATIENCRFERVAGTPVSLVRGGLWSEGPYPSKIRIKDNIFTECNDAFEAQYRPGVITIQCDTKGLIHDIEISNNFFSNNRVGAIFAKNASDISITNNRIDGYLTTPPFDEGIGIMKGNGDYNSLCGLYFDGCSNILLKDNSISEKGEFAIEKILIKDTCENVTLDN